MTTSSLHIALIFPRIQKGGGEQMLFNLTRILQQLGHTVRYYALESSTMATPEGLPASFIPTQRWGKLFKLWQLRRQMAKDQKRHGKFDLVLSNLNTRKPLIANPDHLFYFLHVDIWGDIQASYPDNPKKIQRRICHSQAYYNDKNVIAVSKGAEQSLLAKIHAKPRSIRTIYNPFDFEYIRQQANAYQPEITEPYLIHIGRFDKQKRHDRLLATYALLKNPPKLVLFTNHPDALQDLVNAQQLNNNVIVKGWEPNPFPWIKQAKALLLSSDFEALPTVLIEALVCGTPVVSTDCPSGPREILCSELSTWLVPMLDNQAFADKIQEVLDHPYQPHPELLQRFDKKVIVPQYLNLVK